MLVDALTTDGKLNVEDGTLSEPACIEDGRGGTGEGVADVGLEVDVHLADKVAVTGDRDRDAA